MASTATPTAMLVGTAIIAAISGYMIGIASSLGFLPIPFAPRISQSADNTPARRDANYHDEAESSEEEVEDSNLDHAPNWAQGLEADRRDGLSAKKIQRADEREKQEWELVDSNEECKMVLVVRADLGMTKGKIAAQCGHATLACYKTFLRDDPRSSILRRWEKQGQAKVALKTEDENEMALLQAKAISLGLVAQVISDAGRTQIAAGSQTVLGIGPAPVSIINKVTGHLKLL